MKNLPFFAQSMITISIATALTACGGGGGDSGSTTTTATINNPTITTTTDTTANSNASTTTTSITETAILNQINTQRSLCGFGTLSSNSNLKATASNHANYLNNVSATNKTGYASHHEISEDNYANTGLANPYYSGYDIKARLNSTRFGTLATKTNYSASGYAENLAVSTLNTTNLNSYNATTVSQSMLNGLLAAPYHMRGLLSPAYTQIGIGFANSNWQTTNITYPYAVVSVLELVSARPSNISDIATNSVLHYPCNGITNTEYELNHEEPNPFGTTRDLSKNPIGQPIYVLAPTGKTISNATATITLNNVSIGTIHTLLKSNNPNESASPLNENEVFFMPDLPLQPSSTYKVSYQLVYSDNTTASNSFSFTTKAKS